MCIVFITERWSSFQFNQISQIKLRVENRGRTYIIDMNAFFRHSTMPKTDQVVLSRFLDYIIAHAPAGCSV